MTDVVLLDGGMGQELLRRSGAEPTPLWSAQVMMDTPDIVRDLHADFIRAGAKVIIVNAYSATQKKLERFGDRDRFHQLQTRACELAVQARDQVGENIAIAGCLPPLEWSYRPELVGPDEEIIPLYREMAEAQADHVDFFICETITTGREGRAAALGAAATGKPVWMAWTLKEGTGGRVRSGETLAEANAELDGIDIAVRLINCCPPEDVDAGLDDLLALGGPVGAYANGFRPISEEFVIGTTVKVLEGQRPDLDPDAYADVALGWVDRGVSVVGGCCEIGPAHIARLKERLGAAGHTILRPA
ncbi:MAG: homocysteine S-methyltransferase family protein [Pseudomonadota bacterium]